MVHQIAQTTEDAAEAQDPGQEPSYSNPEILIVDDNENNRFTLAHRLRRLGYENIREAEDGAQALELLKRGPVHLILCDIMMPVMDGYDFLRNMRRMEESWDVPVIMISALDEIDSVVRCIELGAEDYLSKPFNPVLLKARVLASLEKQRLRSVERIACKFHDPTTGLPNRKRFEEVLAQELQRCAQSDHKVAVLRINVDQMRTMMQSLGREATDSLAFIYGKRLRKVLHRPNILARFGHAEFALLVPGYTDNDQLMEVVEELRMHLREPADVHGTEVIGTASIGISTCSENMLTVDQILSEADSAMNHAQADGGDQCQISDPKLQSQLLRRLTLEADLRRCVQRQELELFYQPVVDLPGQAIAGFEALMRWRHPQKGLIAPFAFIPIAEETGTIVEMGEWAIFETARQLVEWRNTHPGLALSAAVNVSARQFQSADLVGIVRRALDHTGVPPSALKLEITETAILRNPTDVERDCCELVELGVCMALDDFGTGYSSLSYLHRLPFEFLKIDRSFVTDIQTTTKNAEITRAIVALAQSLEMKTVAEGIETEDELAALNAMGVSLGQGYLFGKPLDVRSADVFLSTRTAA